MTIEFKDGDVYYDKISDNYYLMIKGKWELLYYKLIPVNLVEQVEKLIDDFINN